MNIAIFGAGYAGRYYVDAIKELTVKLVGICNRSEERGQFLADDAQTKYYPTIEELTRQENVDVLIVATATAFHVDVIKAALKNGIKNIFCEKPAGTSTKEAVWIEQLCANAGARIGIGYKMRYETLFQSIHQCIAQGKIGSLMQLTMDYFQPLPHSRWYLDQGFLSEAMSHVLDLSNWLYGGAPTSLVSHLRNTSGGKAENLASLILRYDHGGVSSLNGGWVEGYPKATSKNNIAIEAVGTKGYLRGYRPDKLILCDSSGNREIKIIPVNPIISELQSFFACVQNNLSPDIGIQDALHVHEVVSRARTLSASE